VLLAAGPILLEVIVERDALYTVQALLLVGVVASLGAGSVAWVTGVGPYPQVTTTPLLFGWVFAIASAVFFRAPLFDSPPAARRLGRERLLSEFADGVVVIDDEGRIVEANPAATDLLAPAGDDGLVGRSLDDLGVDGADAGRGGEDAGRSGEDAGRSGEDAGRGGEGADRGGGSSDGGGVGTASIPLAEGRHRVSLATDSGPQPFEITVSPVRGESGTLLGHTLVFQDVSEETRRRQQLSVLNRVLRHNLRNDMTVVRAYAEELSDVEDERRAEMAETILEEADGLLSLGEQARTIEESLSQPDRSTQPVDLGGLIAEVVEPYRDRAAVTVDVPADLQLDTDPRSLAAVLTAAVDNAVEHSAAGEPTVAISATADGDRATIAVADDGPGIPEHELEPIRSGTETDLEHGSGLGLWLITWGAGSLGGEVTFRTGGDDVAAADTGTAGDGGTTVELAIPRSEPPSRAG
jgi:signal transduction histidine kinase